MTPLWAIGLTIIATILGAIGALYFKLTSDKLKNIIKILVIKELYIAGFFYLLSTVFFIYALKHGELSILYPIISASYVWVTLLSIKFLKEKMNTWKWIGIITIVIGVVLIGLAS